MPDRARYVPHPLDALAEVAAKLDALAALIGACQDINVVNADGLAMLITDQAHQVEDATDALQIERRERPAEAIV
jgi:hypothetical protein